MKYLKNFEDLGLSTYPGPPIVNQASSTLAAGASDGMIGGGAGFGMTGAMGGEFPKKQGPTSKPYPDKFKQTIKNIDSKETKKRKDAIKRMKRLDMLSFADFQKKEKEKTEETE